MPDSACPSCETTVDVSINMRGLTIQCPHCGKSVIIPSPHLQPPAISPPVLATPPGASAHLPDADYRPMLDNMGSTISRPTTSWMAVLSLLLALLSFPACCCTPLSIAAVACGHIGLSDIRKSAGRLNGEELCMAGLIIGYFTIILWAIVAIAVGMLSACSSFLR